MKRILTVFALLVCFALPAQIASAYSFDPAKSLNQNLSALSQESGNRIVAMNGAFKPASGYYFNLVQVYIDKSLGIDALGVQAQNMNGLSALVGMEYADLVLNLGGGTTAGLNDRTAVKWFADTTGNDMLLEFDGGSITVNGASIFCVDLNGDGNFMDAIYVLTPGHAPAVPAPAAALLLGTGVAGMLTLRRKQR